jgi:2-methylcitrate dehydratase PrpD
VTPTQRLLSGLEDLRDAPLDPSVAQAVRLRLLDTLGCLIAGAAMLRTRDTRTRTLLDSSAGAGPVRVVGFDRACDPQTAALVNGMSNHMAELDDGHRYGIVHAGAVVLPALLSVRHDPRVTGESFLRGLLLGYEAAIRVARTSQPHAKDAGWHGTGTFGCIGAAIGVAAALGANTAQLNAALAAGATSASGLLNVIRGASELKPYNAGQAAQAGLSSALTAMAGFAGPIDVLGGHQGFLNLMGAPADAPHPDIDVTSPYCVETVYLKPYASCRYAHAPVEAVLQLRAAHSFDPAQVARVEVDTFRWAVFKHDHRTVTNVSDAKMSVPYCVAAALVSGETGMAAFSARALQDRATLDLAGHVDVREDAAMTALVPHRRPAKVTVHLHSGEAHSARIELPKGEPETAMTPQELRDKFVDLAVFGGVDAGLAQSMADTITDPLADVLPVLDML